MSIERIYFPINESLAKHSQSLWSFSEYAPNSATEDYKKEVDKAYVIVDKIAEEKPDRLLDALLLVANFSKAYAAWVNKGYSIEMMCPSVMISGGSNFPVRKKEKQNVARDRHMAELENVNHYLEKLKNILYGKEIIKSGDEDAIEKLQSKLDELEKDQQFMKDLNKYYKKNNTCIGFQGLTEEKAKVYDAVVIKNWDKKLFASYHLTNNNAKIKATKQRLESLQKAKEKPTQESETLQSDICQVIENTEIMRLQLIFDGKPDEATRNILKSNGFHWSPTNNAWQRQLTNNARYATKSVLKQLEEIQ